MTVFGSTRELYMSVQIRYTHVWRADVSVSELVALPKLTPKLIIKVQHMMMSQ
jgi:hypothetical protein